MTTAVQAPVLDPVELVIDVTADADIGMSARTTATVHLPAAGTLASPPVVCFAFPGGGYSRRYYTLDLRPEATDDGIGQAEWHAARGWIFVSCDSLGFGDATAPESDVLSYESIARGNKATVAAVLARLESGTLLDGYPPVTEATTLGLGQSMGGCFTIVLQGQHQVFDGIGVLGYSAIHTVVPNRPGAPPIPWPWILRGSDLANPKILNLDSLRVAAGAGEPAGEHPFTWAFHWDSEPADIIAADMDAALDGYPGPLPPWRSPSTPSCGIFMVAPGTVAQEAAAITVPVLVAVGERDVVPNPRLEPSAYQSSRDISLLVCPRMAHMHNFADTRHEFWAGIHTWGTAVAARRTAQSRPSTW